MTIRGAQSLTHEARIQKALKTKGFLITHLAAKHNLNWPEAIYNLICVPFVWIFIHVNAEILIYLITGCCPKLPQRRYIIYGICPRSSLKPKKIINSETHLVPRVLDKGLRVYHNPSLNWRRWWFVESTQEQFHMLDFNYVSHQQVVTGCQHSRGSALGQGSIQVLGLSWPGTGSEAEKLKGWAERGFGNQACCSTSLALRGHKPSSTFL